MKPYYLKTPRLELVPMTSEFLQTTHAYAADPLITKMMTFLPSDSLEDTQKFIDEIKGGCNFCGMSALMTTTMTVMKTIIDITKEQGLRDKVTMMVGGAPITQVYCDKIGADVYGETANETTDKAKKIAQDA